MGGEDGSACTALARDLAHNAKKRIQNRGLFVTLVSERVLHFGLQTFKGSKSEVCAYSLNGGSTKGHAKVCFHKRQAADQVVHLVHHIEAESDVSAHSCDHIMQARARTPREQNDSLIRQCFQWNAARTCQRMIAGQGDPQWFLPYGFENQGRLLKRQVQKTNSNSPFSQAVDLRSRAHVLELNADSWISLRENPQCFDEDFVHASDRCDGEIADFAF